MANTTEFRGYGPLTLYATAAFALIAGLAQGLWVSEPSIHRTQYVALWLTTGVLSAALIVTQMLTRANRLHSGMADEMIRMAVTQFLPAGITGIALPFVLLHAEPNVFWTLPGLWQTVFGLGVFASRRCLPRPMVLAGAWFLLCGLTGLYFGGPHALAPAKMSFPFAVGMAIVATIHYHSAKKAPLE